MEDRIPIQIKDQTIPNKETVEDYLRRGGHINRVPQGASATMAVVLTSERQRNAQAKRVKQ